MEQTKENIIISWVVWHFYEMPRFLLSVWNNYISFGDNFFSVHLLIKTLVSPWRRYKWRYPKGFDAGEFFSTLISNVFSRIIGTIFRIVLIILGVATQIFIVVAGFIVFIVWLLIPFILVFSLWLLVMVF